MTKIPSDSEPRPTVATPNARANAIRSDRSVGADPSGSGHAAESDLLEKSGFIPLLFRNKWLITLIALFATIGALAASLLVQKRYRATTLVMVVNRHAGGMGAATSVLSNMSGLASLVGLSGGLGNSKAQALATLQSAVLTRKYIERNDLLPILFSEKWNPNGNRWRNKAPTLWSANAYFNKHVRTVFEDPRTGLIRVAITWTNPALAAKWANGIVESTNEFMRKRAIREANRDIAYLQSEADKTTVVQLRSAIYTLMQQEIREEMIAKGERDYSLKVIDPAFVPEKPYSPLPLIWTVTGLFVGLALGVSVATAKEGIINKRGDAFRVPARGSEGPSSSDDRDVGRI